MKLDFQGKHVLVTGGGRGIGAACCRSFAALGATVLVHYRSRHEGARSLASSLDDSGGRKHRLLASDLAESKGVEELFEVIVDHWGKLDVLVNNAGVWVENPIEVLDDDGLEETWQVNLRSVFYCVHAATEVLTEPDANIVTISSTAGQRGESRYSPYAASKGALIAATKSWAVELAPEVRVNAVAPGWVDTEMCTQPFAGEGRREIESTIPLGRVATPDDIAAAVVFLASPLARHITGEVLNVNGGSVLCG